MFTVMVVEDDLPLQRMMCAFLGMNGYQTIPAANGEKAMEAIERVLPDLVIADVMMPVMDGWELTRELRSAYPLLPIMLVTARDTIEDKRAGFTSGADDYLTKPVDLDELLLHVKALLRRSQVMTSHRLTVGETTLDYNALTVSRDGTVLTLPKKEFYLLFKLLSSPMQIFTRRQLMDEIWGMDAQSDERTVDVHVKRLREKCEVFPDFAIVTVRGLGYKAEKRNG
ncbi:MAG: response regulator transcription factor [Christensenellaceae bacterium]|nr:response regulator transcription factor [Christensenellaceae bacterium]